MNSFKEFIGQFKKIMPLSNFDIMDECKKLKIKNFKGVFMRDELENVTQTSGECLIINTDHSSNGGTHWTCLFSRNGKSFYFDPYGLAPPSEVTRYCKEPRVYSSFEIQKPNEVICGHYCIFVLFRLSNCDEEFFDVVNKLYQE